MTDFTPNYGALTEIVDNTASYSMKDSTDTDYTFEVYPLRITQNDINEALSKNAGVWFIAFQTNITPPFDTQIQKALQDGLLIKLSMNCILVDNFGFQHMVEFDRANEKYRIKFIQNYYHIKNIDFIQFSDIFIDLIKESSNPKMLVQGMSVSCRVLFTKIFKHIYDLEEKVKTLEQK